MYRAISSYRQACSGYVSLSFHHVAVDIRSIAVDISRIEKWLVLSSAPVFGPGCVERNDKQGSGSDCITVGLDPDFEAGKWRSEQMKDSKTNGFFL